jgi:AraC family transcriptional regulator
MTPATSQPICPFLAHSGDQIVRENGAYGRRLAAVFNVEEAPVLKMRSLRKADIACTEILADRPNFEMTAGLPREDAYLVSMQLRGFQRFDYWEDGRNRNRADVRRGDTLITDLKRGPSFLLDKPGHSIHYYLSRASLNVAADEANAPRISELRYVPGQGSDDGTMRDLSMALYPSFENPEQASRLFVDHVTMAIATHLAHTYGGMRTKVRAIRGGLAPWQVNRAQDVISAGLDGNLALQTVAQECGLSTSHFSRAFRQSTGVAPHAWLLQRRVDAAKAMLRDRRLPLSEVALGCGFADQSHFTRVFSRLVGVSPGLWRRTSLSQAEGGTE